MTAISTGTKDREIVLSREFNTPRNLVWEVRTNPEHIKHRWGPDGFTNTIEEMDVKPGGTRRFTMHGPNSMNFPNVIVYKEVAKPERLVYVHGDGEAGPAEEFHVTVTFEENNGKTTVTMSGVFATAEHRDKVVKEAGAIEGGIQTFNRMGEYLAKLL